MYAHRISTIQKALARKSLGALWISHPVHVRYLSGFHMPEDARILIGKKSAHLFTDRRYENEHAHYPDFDFHLWESRTPLAAVQQVLKRLRARTVGFETHYLTLAAHAHLKKALTAKLVPADGIVEQLRIIKDAAEVKRLRTACSITDDAFRSVCAYIRPGRTERDIAWHIESYMRTHGAEALAFDSIIASGKNGDKPHALVTDRVVEAGDLVTIDIGARVDGYHADMTRTIAVGYAPEKLQQVYEVVREAQDTAVRAVAPSMTGADIDAIARNIIVQAGFGDAFAHSTGHGVGLEIHEAPYIGERSKTVLKPGMAITVEPGIYIAGLGGVRIEDTVLVTERGYTILTTSPKDLAIV